MRWRRDTRSASTRRPQLWQREREGREREKKKGRLFWVIYLDFIFIVPGHAKVTIYRFFFEALSVMQLSYNKRYMPRVRSSFCVLRRDEKRFWRQYTRDIIVGALAEVISLWNCEIDSISDLLGKMCSMEDKNSWNSRV